MINLNEVQFMTTPEGIRGAKIVCTDKISGNKFPLIYIHRYDVGQLIGLKRHNENRIRWDELFNSYNQIFSYVEDPGFSTPENKPSSKSIPSQYELQLPEYIKKEAIYFMAMRLDNPQAISYQSDLASKVIPFFEQHASSDDIYSTAVIGDMTKASSYICAGPMSMNIKESRRNLLESDLRELSNFYMRINGINAQHDQNLTMQQLYTLLFEQIDCHLIYYYGYRLVDTCYMMLNKQIYQSVTNQDIMECILSNTWLFNIARSQVVVMHNVIEDEVMKKAMDPTNKDDDPELDEYVQQPPTAVLGDYEGKKVVEFYPLHDSIKNPHFAK